MILETLILHGSDFLEWFDVTGMEKGAGERVSPLGLDIRILAAPKDTRLSHKESGTAIWRIRPPESDLKQVVPGRAMEADLAPPNQPPYQVAGTVSDPSGRFLPRHFTVACGNAKGHRVALHRAPAGMQVGASGGLRGSIRFDPPRSAPWIEIVLEVTIPMADPIKFRAQADGRGEFLLPLAGLPMPVSAPSDYAATLAFAAASADDPSFAPDTAATPVSVAMGLEPGGGAVYGPALGLRVAPGALKTVASPDFSQIVLTPN
jgi:hypothetical protein